MFTYSSREALEPELPVSYVPEYVDRLLNAIHLKAKAMTRKRNEAMQINAPQSVEIDYDLYRQSVAEAAYYKAEKRGFIPGFEAQDWVEAEAEYSLPASGGAASKQYES